LAPNAGTNATTPATELMAASQAIAADPYTVIARRYRPQTFEDVVGQDHVVQALRNAIRMNRVTHAYLFSGTRGVGKTSIARIFAKCLNCVKGPTVDPCNQCDVCQAISTGEDVDVIEIDGASNNGVDAVRELRQNAGLRPSRARYKIYYIDEVHMLSTGAFNALLKTLEEPPGHVKFFFATTEANKIPITVLSRCQRYDFASITPEQTLETLTAICRRERVEAEPDALRIVARRATGSMRDAQSLLEQLLSAGGETLTVEAVHQRLGTASDERLLDVIDALADHDPAAVLTQVESAVSQGVQPADLLNGLLDYLRDVMVLSVGEQSTLLAATPRQRPRLAKVVSRWPLDTVLAALQILAEARARLRGSPHGRTVVEVALVKVARLENLSDLTTLVARLAALESGAPVLGASLKKKPEPATPLTAPTRPAPVATPSPQQPSDGDGRHARLPRTVTPAPTPDAAPLDISAVREIWPALMKKLGTGLAIPLQVYHDRLADRLTIVAPATLVLPIPADYNHIARAVDSPEARAKMEEALSSLLRRPVSLRVERVASGATASTSDAEPASARQRGETVVDDDPLVRKVVELFEARRLHLDYEAEAPPS
jgi:DNA polymerase III subunit gamma/tau